MTVGIACEGASCTNRNTSLINSGKVPVKNAACDRQNPACQNSSRRSESDQEKLTEGRVMLRGDHAQADVQSTRLSVELGS